MKIKKGDFIEIEYIGRIKDTNQIFDLTDEKLAKQHNLYNKKINYGPVIICIGENEIVKGLDKFLDGKELGEYKGINIPREEAFGKKDPKLIKLVSTSIFKKQNITPFPGLQINIDGLIGTIRTISGGRALIDFNHPLAGRDLVYDIKINKIIEEDKEKLKGFLKLHLNNADFELKEEKAEIKVDIPEAIQKILIKKIKELIPNIKEVKFIKQSIKNN